MTPYSWPLRSSLELGALPTAVPCARLHARQLAWEWGLEPVWPRRSSCWSRSLMTNAVQTMAGQDDQPAVRLRLLSDNARVRIEVWDADPRPPAPKDPEQTEYPTSKPRADAGCSWWRHSVRAGIGIPRRSPPGKVVWCELETDPAGTSLRSMDRPRSRRLPRRSARRSAGTTGCGHERSGYSASAPGWTP